MPIESMPYPERGPVPVNFGRRALAYLLDLSFLFALTVGTSALCVFAYSHFQSPGDAATLARVAASAKAGHFTKAAHILYYFSYFTIAHWYFGRSLGKWAMGLTLRSRDGQDLTFARALGRSLLYVVSGQLALGIGFLLPLLRKDGLTLHDLLAATEVVDAAKPLTGDPAQTDRAAA